LPLIGMLIILLSACKSNLIMAPQGTVPKRSQLDRDGFGGYITLMADGYYHTGELIGVRNDTIVVLGDKSLSKISMEQITYGQVIVHSPNSYVAAGVLPMIPNIALFTISGYGGSPAGLGILLSAINAGGLAAASGTENLKYNYFDWSTAKAEVLKYSRFPGGIPAQVRLDDLQPRPLAQK
jgi:hypothetical protein